MSAVRVLLWHPMGLGAGSACVSSRWEPLRGFFPGKWPARLVCHEMFAALLGNLAAGISASSPAALLICWATISNCPPAWSR